MGRSWHVEGRWWTLPQLDQFNWSPGRGESASREGMLYYFNIQILGAKSDFGIGLAQNDREGKYWASGLYN